MAHVHELVERGYQRLDVANLAEAEEPDITGQLVAAICDVLNSRRGPAWRVHYFVRDDPPVGRRGGRGRPRVDIEFERSSPLPRPRFQFEAKRLHSNGCVGRYLGTEGLGCFISKRYAVDHDDAGMLGYVQRPDNDQWSERLQKRLRSSQGAYQLRGVANPWPTATFAAANGLQFWSVHERKKAADVNVSHTLLRFY